MLGFHYLHKRIKDPDTGEVYLERWQVGFRNWFSIKLHRIWRKDFGRELHDHPWNFTSFIMTGGYREHLYRDGRHQHKRTRPFQLVCRTMADRHRIDEIFDPCWTLVVCGPRRKDWGFWLDDDTWIPHTQYLKRGDTEMGT